MSLAVRAGERVGIVGRSGAGKSTVLAALLRLVEGERGCIRLAGIDVTMVGLGTLRRAAVVGQEPAFCDGSLRLNLDADGTRTDDELWELLAACRLDAVVRVLPELLGNLAGATGLSRGQLQLLCVVRALAKRAPLLLLDEATSALDDATERAMQAALDAAAAAGAADHARDCAPAAHDRRVRESARDGGGSRDRIWRTTRPRTARGVLCRVGGAAGAVVTRACGQGRDSMAYGPKAARFR